MKTFAAIKSQPKHKRTQVLDLWTEWKKYGGKKNMPENKKKYRHDKMQKANYLIFNNILANWRNRTIFLFIFFSYF